MFLRAEFLDDDRTEICGHGETGFVDGMPVFEDAEVLGVFTKAYIEKVEEEDGEHEYCVGEGEIDALCYNNYVRKLAKDISSGSPPSGSIEILKTDDNDAIVYKYGYKSEGRIPAEFIFSGYALLGVQPADDAARVVELNKKTEEGIDTMTDNEIKVLVSQVVSEMSTHASEINACKADCETKIAEANAAAENAVAEKNEALQNVAALEAALNDCRNDLNEAHENVERLYAEMDVLRAELAAAHAKERIRELNEELKDFSDEEREYAKDEIEAFKNDPVNSEINSVVNKVWEGIGKKAKTEAENQAAVVAEQNAAKETEDIFSEVSFINENDDDDNIF